MAFGAEELRVLRRALALALHPSSVSAEDVQACLRLAESVDEAVREGDRLCAFLVADLARYRAALPGSAIGYLALLEDALNGGYQSTPDDVAALRALGADGNPVAVALLHRCTGHAGEAAAEPAQVGTAVPGQPAAGGRTARQAGQPTEGRTDGQTGPRQTEDGQTEDGQTADRQAAHRRPAAAAHVHSPHASLAATSRIRLLALPGGLAAKEPAKPPKPKQPPTERPAPQRPVPTPAEVFPPKRKPAPPPAPPQKLAAV
ncbi:hypothetical protein STSP_60630 [Streptomyces jeddahensis]|uniref:Uncharacterized protein n=2 Tax=Streptomyces jeddahensis TaxID=1716141 RepID=A0A177HK77_9ACTN|nr:hypothetical protein STSP_60630 [Streptomyces jeddahensis]